MDKVGEEGTSAIALAPLTPSMRAPSMRGAPFRMDTLDFELSTTAPPPPTTREEKEDEEKEKEKGEEKSSNRGQLRGRSESPDRRHSLQGAPVTPVTVELDHSVLEMPDVDMGHVMKGRRARTRSLSGGSRTSLEIAEETGEKVDE